MNTERDIAEYVRTELLELVSAALDVGLADLVGFEVEDGELHAEVYHADGETSSNWKLEITVVQEVAER